jgi:L-alanine-DL-glutamate epimerase-like enolase superfamily enzyme
MRASRIASVESITVQVPLDRAASMATRSVSARHYPLVRLTTQDGLVGIGFSYAGETGGKIITQAIRDLLAPILLGEDATDIERLWERMYRETLLLGRGGAVMRAISMIDIALWDRNARARDLPLFEFLGGKRAPINAYASAGYYFDGKDTKMLADEMASLTSRGFRAVKIKIGRLSPPEEEARVAAVRAAIGPDVHLMLDANNAWPDLSTALSYMERLEAFSPYWIEEPFSPDEIDAHAALAKSCVTPVATGELEAGHWRFRELLEKKAASILQPDAAVCGGITEFRRIAADAVGHGASVAPHWFHDLHIHLVAATPGANWVEYLPDAEILNFRRLLDRQIVWDGSHLNLPETPGLGFQFDAAMISKFSLDQWA